MPTNHFDEPVAAGYDEGSAEMFDPEVLRPTVDLLAGLAGAGPALELAVGTGRVALPLSQRGVPVHGIELSPAMAAQLAAKPGGTSVPVTIGDMASTRVTGSFTLVYLVFNTIANLTSQDEQVRCFRNAAAHLADGGCFVVELFVPILQRLPPGEASAPSTMTPTGTASTSTTSRRSRCSPTTTASPPAATSESPCPSATHGRPSST